MIRALVLASCLGFGVAGAAAPAVGLAGGDTRRPHTITLDTIPPDTTPPDTLSREEALRQQVLQKLRALDSASRLSGRAAGDTGAVAAAAVVSDPVVPDSVVSDSTVAIPETERGLDPEAVPHTGVLLASDSVVARLRALQGYVVTEYRAASATFVRDSGRLELVGSPELVRGSESMTADSLLRYDQQTSIICGFGNPVLTGTGSDPVSSDQVCYDVGQQQGYALGARTTFSQQGTWFIHGSELFTVGQDRIYGADTDFTSCSLEEPHYHFSASQLKVVHDHVMVARNVTLKFGDVPVFWLPFLIQSLKPDRRSGLLAPSIGMQHVVRTSSGYRREIRDIGFYWAINDHLGLTSAMDWQSGGYISLRGRLQYRWLRQFLSGDLSFSRFWKAEGGTDFTLSGNTSWQPGERTSLRAAVNYSSSNDLVRRYSVDPEELNRSIASNIGVNHRFDWGNLSLSGSRRQHLSNDQVDLTLPSVTLSLNPVTLFRAQEGARWYNNATWQNNASFTARRREVNALLPHERTQPTATLQGSFDSRINVGRLNWSGSFRFDEEVAYDRPTWFDPRGSDTEPRDSLVFDRAVNQTMRWNTGLSFMQRLIEDTYLSPSISLAGGVRLRTDLPDSLGVEGHVEEPVRLNLGASLRTNIYGFWPGMGPYTRIRHRLEPSLSYTYSPAPTVTDLQRRAFGTGYDALRETNQLRLSVNQTFEAKPRTEPGRGGGEPGTVGGSGAPGAEGTAGVDSVATGADTTGGAFGEAPPRRLPRANPITLLSVTSSAVMYDFVRAREGDHGFTTEQMSHSIRSDLVKGLSLSVGHDLFKKEAATADQPTARRFSPRLRTVNAQFSLSHESWPFRLFGRGGGGSAQGGDMRGDQLGEGAPGDSPVDGELGDISRSIMPGSGHTSDLGSSYRGQGVGTWRGDFGYSLTRPAAGSTARGNQMLTAGISFQPTENWNVRWQTGYSFTTHEFSDHVLSLTRDLHRWRASFYFSRTQFGAFSFRFNVQLIDNPDIKVDYDQRSQVPPNQFR